MAREAWQAMYTLVFEGEGRLRFHEACDATGLTPALLKTLLQLEPSRPVAIRELAEAFHCDPSYVTSLVDGLEAAGLAERHLHPTDRRVKVVALSDHGVEVLGTVREIIAEPPAALSALNAAELRQLRDLVAKVAGADARAATA